MRVKMKSIMAGPNGMAHPGQIIDVERAHAYALVEGGHAEQVDEDVPEIEEVVRAAPETATRKGRSTRA